MVKYIDGIPSEYFLPVTKKRLFSGDMVKAVNPMLQDFTIVDGLPKPIRWSPQMGFSWNGHPLSFEVCDNLQIVKPASLWTKIKAPFVFFAWAWKIKKHV